MLINLGNIYVCVCLTRLQGVRLASELLGTLGLGLLALSLWRITRGPGTGITFLVVVVPVPSVTS